MLSLYQLKPRFQQLLRPVLAGLHQLGISPNQLTLSALFLSAGIGLAIYFAPDYPPLLLLVPLGLLIRMALNALDGLMARQYQQQSKAGEVLNEICDVLSDAMIYLPLIRWEALAPWLVIAFVWLALLNEFAAVLAKASTGTRRNDGPMGKSDRAAWIGLISLMLFCWPGFGAYLGYALGLSLLLLLYSTAARLWAAMA